MSKRNKIAIRILLGLVALVGLGVGAWQFIAARNTSASNACINNLRQLDAWQQQWALEHDHTNGPISSAAANQFVHNVEPTA